MVGLLRGLHLGVPEHAPGVKIAVVVSLAADKDNDQDKDKKAKFRDKRKEHQLEFKTSCMAFR